MATKVDATHATTAAPGAAHKAAFPPFQANTFPGQLLWFAIAFGLLYYVMSKIALPKIGAILENRRQRIAADLDEAHAMRTQSQEAETSYQAALSAARERSKQISDETRAKLNQESDSKRRTLEAELSEKLAAAEATIRSRTEFAMSNVRGVASDAANAIVERLTGKAPDPGALDAALDRTVRS